MLPIAEAVAQRLAREEELQVEIVAPSLLAPMPKGTLIRHLLPRRRVVIVEESHEEYGIAAEIAACLAERRFAGELLRIGTPRCRSPRHAAWSGRSSQTRRRSSSESSIYSEKR